MKAYKARKPNVCSRSLSIAPRNKIHQYPRCILWQNVFNGIYSIVYSINIKLCKRRRASIALPSKHNRKHAIFGTILEGPPHTARQPHKWTSGPNVDCLASQCYKQAHAQVQVCQCEPNNLGPPSSPNQQSTDNYVHACACYANYARWHVTPVPRFRDKRDQRALNVLHRRAQAQTWRC